MTRNEVDALIERASRFVGKEITVSLKTEKSIGKNYIYNGNTKIYSDAINDEADNYRVFGYLESEKGNTLLSLLMIVEAFEEDQ